MSEFKVSVIVPAYKTEKYLEGFLRGVKNQTIFDEIQIILDQNEPSLKELEIARQFKDEYGPSLKLLRSDVLLNIAESMNHCIQNSDADYIAIWNVDDLRENNSLEIQYAKLSQSDSVACSGPYKITNSFGADGTKVVMDIDIHQRDLLRGMYLGPFFMFRKSAISSIGYFDEQFRSGADFDFCIRLARFGSIAYTESFLGTYLDEGLGASTKPNSLQPIERTVIELRYGIVDKVDTRYLIPALKYRINEIKNKESFISVSEVFSDLEEYLNEQQRTILLGPARNLSWYRRVFSVSFFRKILFRKDQA